MKIILVDDHEIILESLSLLLNSLAEVETVITFDNPEKALDYCLNEPFDLLVTDNNMPEMTGCSLALKLRKDKQDSKILMLTVDESYETIRESFQAGILGYVMKKSNKSELKDAIISVAGGKRFISDAVLSELLKPQMTSKENYWDDIHSLTSREIEIVSLIGQELSTKDIADRLFVSIATIEKHRHNILRKLGVKNSIGIAKYTITNGLIA